MGVELYKMISLCNSDSNNMLATCYPIMDSVICVSEYIEGKITAIDK